MVTLRLSNGFLPSILISSRRACTACVQESPRSAIQHGIMQGMLENAKRIALTIKSLSFREMRMTASVVPLCALYARLYRAIEEGIEATRQCGRLESLIAALWQLLGTLASPMVAAASHQESDAQLFYMCPKVLEGSLIAEFLPP